MASGFAQLGDLLAGGGKAGAQNAYYTGQLQQGQVSHLSAQTEEALANAKVAQQKAKMAEKETVTSDNLADAFIQTGLAKTPKEAHGFAILALGKAGNFESFTKGRGELQAQGFRGDVANKDLPLADRLVASSGVQGKVQSYSEGGTPAIQNYNFETSLPDEKAKTAFRTYGQPDKIINAGGVPYSVSRQPGAQPRAVVDPSTVATNTERNAGAKATGAGEAKITLEAPAAAARLKASSAKLDRTSALVDTIANDPDLSNAVGLKKPLAAIWGTGGARVRANIDVLKNRIALDTLSDLRQSSKTGGALGNVSNADIDLLKNSLAALSDKLSPDDFIDQLQTIKTYMSDLKERMSDGYNATYNRKEAPIVPAGTTPPAASDAVVKWGRDASGKPVRIQ